MLDMIVVDFVKYSLFISTDLNNFIFYLASSRSWVRVSRWMPIYVDRIYRQTIIYTPTLGMKLFETKNKILSLLIIVYVLPPLVNFYGKLYSVAELVAYQYATFHSDGAAMSPNFNIVNYANSGACSYFLF